jgi:hypothetical protein
MKKITAAFLLIVAIACQNNIENLTDTKEANAFFRNNSLPADGCDEHIELVDAQGKTIMQCLPTDATKSLLSATIQASLVGVPAPQNTFLEIPVTIVYRETRETGELQCGWGKKLTLNKIEIVSFQKR